MAHPPAKTDVSRRRLLLLQILQTHMVPCLFLGILSIEVLDWLARQPWVEEKMLKQVKYGVVLLLNGAIVGAVVRLYQLFKLRYEGRLTLSLFGLPLDGKHQAWAVAVGCLCGGAGLLLLLDTWGILLLTLLVGSNTLMLFRRFIRVITTLLEPGRYASWQDVEQLLAIYSIMLICFSMSNVSLEMLHKLLHLEPAFAYPGAAAPMIFDSFYYTVVVVTTLGFGDIHPLSVDSRLLLIVQSLSSYFMFALIVGVATRGVLTRKR